jgi:tetratricopeptide (TPR) repeat protein
MAMADKAPIDRPGEPGSIRDPNLITPPPMRAGVRNQVGQEFSAGERRMLARTAKPSADRDSFWMITPGRLIVGLFIIGLLVGFGLLWRANRSADKQRALAANKFRLAQDAIDRYYDVAEKPAVDSPEWESARRQLLITYRDYLRQFIDNYREDPAGEAEVGHAFLQLARITGEIGSKEEAVPLCQQALGIYKRLFLKKDVKQAQYAHALAQCHQAAGALYEVTAPKIDEKAHFEAKGHYEVARDLWERLCADYPHVTEYQAALAGCYSKLGAFFLNEGVLLRDENWVKDAEPWFKKALEIRRRLLETKTTDATSQSEFAAACVQLAMFYKDRGQIEQAKPLLQEELTIRQQLAAAQPNVRAYQNHLADSYHRLAVAYQSAGQTDAADQFYQMDLSIRQTLMRENPSATRDSQSLADSLRDMGDFFRKSNRFEHAKQAHEQCLAIRQKLADDHPKVPVYREALGPACLDLAVTYSLALQAVLADNARSHAERDKLSSDYGSRAVKLLTEAKSAGSFSSSANRERLKNDKDFAPLHSRDDFQRLLKEVDSRQK